MMMPPLPGFHDIGSDQILTADLAIYTRMVSLTRDVVCVRSDGTMPLSDALKEATSHPMVTCLLQPRPMAAQGSDKESSQAKSPVQKNQGPYDTKGKGKTGSKRGKAETRGKGKGTRTPCPAALVGLNLVNAEGKRLCFEYNLPHGCKLSVSSNGCEKGMHQCCGCLAVGHGSAVCPR